MTLARRLLVLPLALLLGGSALAGCATPVASGPASTPSAPSSSPSASVDATEVDLGAEWLDNGRIIGLVTPGSSTCVPMAEEAILQEDGTLAVTLVEVDPETPCTADLVPRVTLVEAPEGVSPAENLTISVVGDGHSGSTELDGVEDLAGGGMTDYLPSAGWTDIDDTFVILTWGSSSCAPIIEEVAASGPSEVVVTFTTPPADQVCTMDMAPRAVIATVPDLDEADDVSVVLTGAEFDNVRIPIYGDN